jgi:hypothetical protein
VRKRKIPKSATKVRQTVRKGPVAVAVEDDSQRQERAGGCPPYLDECGEQDSADGLLGFRTRLSVLTWASMQPARIR